MLVYSQALHVEARHFAVKLAGQPDSALPAFLVPLLDVDGVQQPGQFDRVDVGLLGDPGLRAPCQPVVEERRRVGIGQRGAELAVLQLPGHAG